MDVFEPPSLMSIISIRETNHKRSSRFPNAVKDRSSKSPANGAIKHGNDPADRPLDITLGLRGTLKYF